MKDLIINIRLLIVVCQQIILPSCIYYY